jgi:malate permease and related proteins
MDIFLVTFQSVAALLGIGVLGFWIIGRRLVPSTTIGFLSSLAIDIALPCLVLFNVISDFSPESSPGWWHMPLWWLGFTVVALVLSLLFSFIARKEMRSEFIISLFFQNGIFFPLIVLVGIFGKNNVYLVQLFLFMLLQPSLVFGTYSLFFGKKASENRLNWKRIINPVLISTIVGLVVVLGGLRAYVPDFLVSILNWVGAMALPLFMLILGGNIYYDLVYVRDTRRVFYVSEVIKFVLVKNFLFPLVFLGLIIWLNLEYSIALIIILQAAVPPITAIPILTERSNGNRTLASQYIVGSFVVSVVSIPLVIYLFNHFYPMP